VVLKELLFLFYVYVCRKSQKFTNRSTCNWYIFCIISIYTYVHKILWWYDAEWTKKTKNIKTVQYDFRQKLRLPAFLYIKYTHTHIYIRLMVRRLDKSKNKVVNSVARRQNVVYLTGATHTQFFLNIYDEQFS